MKVHILSLAEKEGGGAGRTYTLTAEEEATVSSAATAEKRSQAFYEAVVRQLGPMSGGRCMVCKQAPAFGRAVDVKLATNPHKDSGFPYVDVCMNQACHDRAYTWLRTHHGPLADYDIDVTGHTKCAACQKPGAMYLDRERPGTYYCSMECLAQPTAEPTDAPSCATCGSYDQVRACKGCHKVYYCNMDCARRDWPAHSLFCRDVAAHT